MHNLGFRYAPPIAFAAMLAIGLLAFGMGPLLYRDQHDPAVPPEAIRRLKTQIAVPYDVRPAILQITEAHMAGPTPDHVEGTAAWRTLFGIVIGSPQHTLSHQHYDLQVTAWILIWGLFLLVEGGLGTLVVWRLLQA